MKVHRAHKTELRPNNRQRTHLRQSAGTARWAYNWGLQRRKEQYVKDGTTLNHQDLYKEYAVLKKTTHKWLAEVSKCAPQEAFRDLDKAFKNFFAGKAKFPCFKSKHRNRESYRLYGAIKVKNDSIRLPKPGKKEEEKWFRLKERGYLPTNKRIISAMVSERAGRWFVSVLTEEELPVCNTFGLPAVGVDLGVKNLAVTSDGTTYENPRALKRHERKLRKLQKAVSRKEKGSKNRNKARKRLARQYYRVACIRKDAISKATTELARTKSVIVVESLNVSGMLKNHRLAKSISDAGMGEFLRQIRYKSLWYGCRLIEADQWYPSSKRCSTCGAVKNKLSLSERTYHCTHCGLVLDRDLNAARNLLALAHGDHVTVVAGTVKTQNACGETVSPPLIGGHDSAKQEPSSRRGVS